MNLLVYNLINKEQQPKERINHSLKNKKSLNNSNNNSNNNNNNWEGLI